jgi:carboxymethylenebutenolidase
MTDHVRHQNVTFPSTSPSGEAHGYLEKPEAGTGPGLIVIQEWWGLDEHIADLVRRFAGEGFVTLAPDLYGGTTVHDREDAARMASQLPVEQAVADLAGAVDYLLGLDEVTSSRVGVVGFCMGGAFVLRLAALAGDKVGAAVPFYGRPDPATDYSGLRAAVQGHYAEHDRSISRDDVVSMTTTMQLQCGVVPQIHWYPAGHAFMNDQRPAFDQHCAALAWSRAVDFLKENLG